MLNNNNSFHNGLNVLLFLNYDGRCQTQLKLVLTFILNNVVKNRLTTKFSDCRSNI